MIALFKRYTVITGMFALVLLGLVLYLRVRYGRPASGLEIAHPSVAVLPKDDKEQIIVDPSRHSLIIVRPTGNQTLSLPDRQSVIDIRKDGTVQVISPQWGWEHRVFFGIHGSEVLRLGAGMDAFYFKKLDLGAGVACQIGAHTPIVFAQISYNAWSNCRVGIAYGTNRFVGGTLTVRL